MARLGFWSLLLLAFALVSRADGPADNIPEKVRRIPPPGISLSPEVRQELTDGTDALAKEIEQLSGFLKGRDALLALLPDVRIYFNAVHYALKYDEFFKAAEIEVARKMLVQGHERAKQLRAGQAPWTTATGLVVRGYVSKIDGSVQPYGLVVPPTYKPGGAVQHRLDFWFHGRGETQSELNFIDGRQKSPGEFTPPNTFVLHPYGRYSNANHFAGEIDGLEALEHVRKYYPIDENRIVVRGFSMGGAACWNYAVHYACRWASAAPGAGFSETPEFLRIFQQETLRPTPYEKKLWRLYDCTDYAVNLFNCPTVAYSGEKDSQKQAADAMVEAMAAENLRLVHIIGPGTGHSYHPLAKAEINRRIDSIAAKGRDPLPRTVRFTTFTLRYNQMFWVTIDALEEHWVRARVDAEIVGDHEVKVKTQNVAMLTLDMPAGHCPLDMTKKVLLHIDGEEHMVASALSDRSWKVHLVRQGKGWKIEETNREKPGLAKRHGLQGPIDDAFMDHFIMVRPTGKPLNAKVGKWVDGEMSHAIEHWRRQFRGEALVKSDEAIGPADLANANLILWGDPSSNLLIRKIVEQLPIGWNAKEVSVGNKTLAGDHHLPVLIYPNPLNPKKYVVINSGFTFREYDYLNNARQVPKLPDWAILDIRQPPTSQYPARIADAGFFNETWSLAK